MNLFQRYGIYTALLALTMPGSGCTDNGNGNNTPSGQLSEACNSSEDCPQGALCVESICRAICNSPKSCDQGFGCRDGVCQKCTADAQCKDNMTCDTAKGICQARCENDSQCQQGFYCEIDGSCTALKENGQAETSHQQHCKSGFAADGFCCDSACDTDCFACNIAGKEGTCSALDASSEGTKDGSCQGGHFTCTEVAGHYVENSFCGAGSCQESIERICAGGYLCRSGNCLTSCESNSDCQKGFYCELDENLETKNSCQPLGDLVTGTACGKYSDCQSGFCVDGVCCESACDTDCYSCNVSEELAGTCSPLAATEAGTIDGNCAGGRIICTTEPGHYLESNFCGAGHCSESADKICPNGFVCSDNACLTSCTNSDDCVAGFQCDLTAGSPTFHTCIGMQQKGQECGVNMGCDAGLTCVDGVCCTSGSCGTCQACNLPGFLGDCTNVGMGQTDADTCPGTQKCTAGTNGYETYNLVCNGNGQCLLKENTKLCGNYSCNGNVCKTSCSTNSDCITNTICYNKQCVAKFENGHTCSSTSQCQPGNYCVDGVCCDKPSCSGNCYLGCSKQKNGIRDGVCMPVPAGRPHSTCSKKACMCDADMCDTSALVTDVCDGSGQCIYASEFEFYSEVDVYYLQKDNPNYGEGGHYWYAYSKTIAEQIFNGAVQICIGSEQATTWCEDPNIGCELNN